MPTTHHVPRESHQSVKPVAQNKRLIVASILLAGLAIVLVWPALFSGDSGNQTALAAGGAADPAGSPTPSTEECLENTAWPSQFEVPFTSHFQKGTPYGPWHGNLLQYQYLETPGMVTANFRSYFRRCTNLPFVPLSFFRKPCEYYFSRDPSRNNEWQAWVYSTKLKKYFRLASNLGPLAPDFVARYQALRPAGCANRPMFRTPMPVRHPPGGEPVEWFLTQGSAKVTPSPQGEGYYAAMATPVRGPDNKLYKPPYAFAGEPPGAGFLIGHKRSVYGELVYDWKRFVIKTSFPPDTFTPPSKGYTEIKGIKAPPPPAPSPSPGASPEPTPPKHPNCVACHMSNLHDGQTFYVEARRVVAGAIIDTKKKKR
ncbi:MAG TPA: hypothetical protein VN476_07510 [Pyrinomonadaceae bacterium]|nr:hypothetical protein [Pyrinomonadaceae bacterium]